MDNPRKPPISVTTRYVFYATSDVGTMFMTQLTTNTFHIKALFTTCLWRSSLHSTAFPHRYAQRFSGALCTSSTAQLTAQFLDTRVEPVIRRQVLFDLVDRVDDRRMVPAAEHRPDFDQ